MATFVIAMLWGLSYLDKAGRKQRQKKDCDKDLLYETNKALINQQIEMGVLNGWPTDDIYFGEGNDIVAIQDYPKNMTVAEAFSILLRNKANVLTGREKVYEFAFNSDGLLAPNDNRSAFMIMSSPKQMLPGMDGPNTLNYPNSTTGSKELQKWAEKHYKSTRDNTATAFGVTPAMVGYYELPFRPQPSN